MIRHAGNQPNSASRLLKTARDLIGVGVALNGEETLPRGQYPETRPSSALSNLWSHNNRLWRSVRLIESAPEGPPWGGGDAHRLTFRWNT